MNLEFPHEIPLPDNADKLETVVVTFKVRAHSFAKALNFIRDYCSKVDEDTMGAAVMVSIEPDRCVFTHNNGDRCEDDSEVIFDNDPYCATHGLAVLRRRA